MEPFAKFPNHINYLHPNIEDMAILYFCHNPSCTCYQLFHIDKQVFPPLISFPTINNISMSAKRSNFTLVFYKATYMLIQKLKKILQDQANIFQDTYFESSQIRQLAIVYHLNIQIITFCKRFPKVFSQIFINSFRMPIICISNIFHI